MTKTAVPEGKFVQIGDGLQIHYHEAGEGYPVLFLHGSGPGASGWSNFKGNFPYIAENGFRALVPDTLGFGYSSKPDTMDYGMDVVVAGVKRMLDTLGIEKCAVIGNSHGGAMSISLALKHPDLVEKLILMAPGGLEERETYMKMPGIKQMIKSFFSKSGITRESMREVFQLQLFKPEMITDQIIEERFQIAETQPKRVISTLKVPYLAPELSKLSCKIFALWGQNDLFCPVSGARTIAENCKNARVLTLTECGHWVMVEYASLFNKMCVDFLKE